MNWIGFGRKQLWLIWYLSQNFLGGTEENHERTSVRKVGPQAKVRTQDLRNMKC
jgi:hypothetical protein